MTDVQARIKQWVDRNPLREYRLANKMTLMQTAATLGVNMTTLQVWERGTVTPKPENFEKIGELIGDPNVSETWAKWEADAPAPTHRPAPVKG